MTMINNNGNLSAGNFSSATSLVAPSANTHNWGNQTVAGAPVSYVAFVTTATQYNAHTAAVNPVSTPMSGVMVKSDVPALASTPITYIVGSRSAAVVSNVMPAVNGPVNGTDVTVIFRDVNTGNPTVNANMNQATKVAYIAGSAAVIQSKFINLTNVDVVRYMDATTEAGQIFRLGNTLSPRAIR